MKEYVVKKDLEQIKEQIKEWELTLDRIVSVNNELTIPEYVLDELEQLSNEMMAINL